MVWKQNWIHYFKKYGKSVDNTPLQTIQTTQNMHLNFTNYNKLQHLLSTSMSLPVSMDESSLHSPNVKTTSNDHWNKHTILWNNHSLPEEAREFDIENSSSDSDVDASTDSSNTLSFNGWFFTNFCITSEQAINAKLNKLPAVNVSLLTSR